MSRLNDYVDIRDNMIRLALEELTKEYEAQGYKCSIGSQGPPPARSSAIGPISFSRKKPKDVTNTVSIYSSGSDWVIFNKLDAVYSVSVLLDDITPNRVKEEVRKALG